MLARTESDTPIKKAEVKGSCRGPRLAHMYRS